MRNKDLKVMSSLAAVVGLLLLTVISCFASERAVPQMSTRNESWSAVVSKVPNKTTTTKTQIRHSGSTQMDR